MTSAMNIQMPKSKRQSNQLRLPSIQRVLELIKLLNEGGAVCINELLQHPYWELLSERTIRRDLGLINEVFPNFFHHIDAEQGCYKAITNEMFDNIVTPAKMALIAQTFDVAKRSQLYSNLNIDEKYIKLIEKQLELSEEHYIFKTKPLENRLADFEMFKKLEHCISYRKELEILFPVGDGAPKSIVVRPYKILFMNENFYLACERTDKKHHFARYRISRILNTKELGSGFKRYPDIEDFINEMQTPFAKYTPRFRNSLFSVVLEADASIIRYFKQKKYLTTQKLSTLENGNFLIEYRVTDEREVEGIIKRWSPLIKVIEPQRLKDKIYKDLQAYLDNN